jgi:DMSO/TMAO reductase YedYZ molybdopterin-dependent catalytic subunit
VNATLDISRPKEKLTRYKDVTTYNNFYEFGTDKADPARNTPHADHPPWTVAVEGSRQEAQGLRHRRTAQARPLEERIYRLRCVEGWSMVIPWIGVSLAELIRGRADRQRQVRRVRHAGRQESRCPASPRRCSTGPMSKGCAWTRRCIR